ncbi:MAG: FAD-dependent oxidoreductase [archaeon]
MRVVILGGGLAGMAAADKLLDQKHEVTILEKEGFLGGMASSFDNKGVLIPKHYHHIFSHDFITLHYLRRFGLYYDMSWKKIRMGIAVNKRIYNFTSPLSLLGFDYLSLYGRLRYGLFGAYVLWLMNPSKIRDDVDAYSWLRKFAGKEVTHKLFYNLYSRNKFNIPLSMISAKQFAYRLKAGEALGRFGYPRLGLDRLVRRLENSLVERGCKIKKNYKIKSVDVKKKVVDNIKADVIINTIPPPQFLRVAKNLPAGYAEKISKIRYTPCITVAFGTRNFLSGHYWINIFNERIGMLIQHSRLFNGYPYKVSWATRYGGSESDLKLSDEEIKKAYLAPVRKYFPRAEILWSKVFREVYAEPVYDKFYAFYNPGYRTPVRGFYNAGIFVTYPKIRNMNTALESGLKVAAMVREDLPSLS